MFMDARGVQRLLERIYGMADTADHVGSKNIETMQRERLRDETKAALATLYHVHALRVQQVHAGLGLAICDAILNDLDDDTARGALDLMRANLQSLHDAAKNKMQGE
jgi:hypothetical protein